MDEIDLRLKVDRINDEVLECIHSIPPGIDSFDAESDLVESVLNRDISIDSSPKIDSLSNEFAGELILPKSIHEKIEEEIDLFLADDGSIPPGIESDDVDSVDDDTSIFLPEFESFYVDYPNSGNSTIDVVMDIPGRCTYCFTHPSPGARFITTHSEFFALCCLDRSPFLAYRYSPSLLSCGDEDTIFDPGISKFHLRNPYEEAAAVVASSKAPRFSRVGHRADFPGDHTASEVRYYLLFPDLGVSWRGVLLLLCETARTHRETTTRDTERWFMTALEFGQKESHLPAYDQEGMEDLVRPWLGLKLTAGRIRGRVYSVETEALEAGARVDTLEDTGSSS
ncbi:hypothetical protein Tco_1104179 [Tanacetum coccineum]